MRSMRWIPLQSHVFYQKYVGVRWTLTFPNCHANIERRTRANTIYLLYTVGRSRSTASTVASCCPGILMYTRNHGLHVVRPRIRKQKSSCRSNNSYDYVKKGEERSSACKAVNLCPRHEKPCQFAICASCLPAYFHEYLRESQKWQKSYNKNDEKSLSNTICVYKRITVSYLWPVKL